MKYLENIKWLFILVNFFSQFSHGKSKVPAIVVFGDSTVDAGNNNQIPTIARSNFGPYGRDYNGGRPTGRFCNGRIATDFISEAFGLKPMVPAYLDPTYNISDFAVGVTFASAGSGYDNATSDVLSVIPLWKEFEFYKDYQKRLVAYLGPNEAIIAIREALYIISLGTNDFLENYYNLRERRSQYTIGQYQDFLVGIAKNFVGNLYDFGARKISLGGLPPMGCLPLERATNVRDGNGCVANYNSVALAFNDKLRGLVDGLNEELFGIDVVFSNPYFVLLDVVQNPSSYGFEEAEIACCASGRFEMGYMCGQFNPFTCRDANKYVFWDSFHPTEKTNSIVAKNLTDTVLKKFL